MLLAVGLYHMVMTENVKAREVFSVFLKNYGVWAILIFLAGWITSHVMDHREYKKTKAAKAAGSA